MSISATRVDLHNTQQILQGLGEVRFDPPQNLKRQVNTCLRDKMAPVGSVGRDDTSADHRPASRNRACLVFLTNRDVNETCRDFADEPTGHTETVEALDL